MDNLSKEVLEALEELKKNSTANKEHSNEVMEVLFIASLLEEENIRAAS